MFVLAPPSAERVAAFVAAQRGAAFSYAEVGMTRGPAPPGYTVDHTRAPLGAGADAFRRAADALRAWRMTALGWVSVQPAGSPVAPGTNVAVVVRHYGFWSLNACRVVYPLAWRLQRRFAADSRRAMAAAVAGPVSGGSGRA